MQNCNAIIKHCSHFPNNNCANRSVYFTALGFIFENVALIANFVAGCEGSLPTKEHLTLTPLTLLFMYFLPDVGMATGKNMDTFKPVRLRQLKLDAAFLLKDLLSGSLDASSKASERFLKLPDFRSRSLKDLRSIASSVKLKHAYTVIAREHGFTSWVDLKNTVVEADCMYQASAVGFVYAWFKSYEAAHAYFLTHNGYLLCFWKDFIVCGPEYIERLGLAVYSTEWQRIGFDWVKPKDASAYDMLHKAAIKNYLSRQ